MRSIFTVFLVILFMPFNLYATSQEALPPQTYDSISINDLLSKAEYQKLEVMLVSLLVASESDLSLEPEVRKALEAFTNTSPIVEKALNEWISTKPDSYVAYLARGIFYYEKGLRARGTDYIQNTSGRQKDGMVFYFEKSVSDLNKSIQLHNKLIPAYVHLIRITTTLGDMQSSKDIYQAGLKVSFYSSVLRYAYAQGLTPRWGGSETEFNDFIKTGSALSEKNSNLKILEALYLSEIGNRYKRTKKFKKALAYYGQAIDIYPYDFFYYKRGTAYYSLKKYDLASNDFNKAVSISPYFNQALSYNAYSYLKQRKYHKALNCSYVLLERDPTNTEYIYLKGIILDYLGSYDESIATLRSALEIDPNNGRVKGRLDKILAKNATKNEVK